MAAFVLVAACVSGFAAAFVAAPAVVGAASHAGRQLAVARSVLEDGPSGAGAAEWVSLAARMVMRNGVAALLPLARAAVSVPAVRSVAAQAVRSAEWRGFATGPARLLSVVFAAVAALGVLVWICSGSPIAGAAALVLGLWAAAVQASRLDAKRDELLREQVPDALQCLSVCFQAGLSLPQAFLQTARESPSPAREMFARVAHDVETGRPVDDALRAFRDASGVPELAFVSVALDVQHVCGGSIAPVLESAEDSVRKGLEMKRFLRTHTAQARLSAQMVSVMPLALMALMSAASPGFMAPFFASAEGVALLTVAVAMQVAGVLIVRRMLETGVV